MDGQMKRGLLEACVLTLLSRGESYGYQLIRNLGPVMAISESTLYPVLRRLEAAGCIQSYWGDETTGARRRYYAVTEAGRELYRENLADWQKVKTIIDNLLQGENGNESQN